MNKKSGTSRDAADKLVRGIKRKARKHYSAEEKIRIVLAGLRGEESVRRQSFSESAGCFVTEALVRFLFEFRRQRIGAATGVF